MSILSRAAWNHTGSLKIYAGSNHVYRIVSSYRLKSTSAAGESDDEG